LITADSQPFLQNERAVQESKRLLPAHQAAYTTTAFSHRGFQFFRPETLPAIVYSVTPHNSGLLIRTAAGAIRALALCLRHRAHWQFRSLVDIAVVDRLRAPARFSINYLFLSVPTNQRALVQLFSSETSTIPTLSIPYANGQRYFAASGWLEREVWDMFGIYFSEHSDLRRILTDYGFTGHPLRKDFPLTGFHELVYNDAEGRVVSTSVELAQEFRVFTFE
jgi:NADH:ubiquinone oxidoreductase subunit C